MSKVKLPSLEEMLKAGVHFGHQKSKWHPKMAPFIFTQKNKVHIINLEKTRDQLQQALDFVTETVANGGQILFLGTKKQAKKLVKDAAMRCGMPYVTERWLGGTFTNAKSVLGLVKNYKKLKADAESGKLDRFTKRERLKFQRKVEKLDPVIGGLAEMPNIPAAMFVVDVKTEKTAVLEANKVGVPVVAMCDTNINPKRVDHVIPANDDAIKSIDLIVNLVAEAVEAGKKQAAAQSAPKEEEK